jgi:hypothetical protein
MEVMIKHEWKDLTENDGSWRNKILFGDEIETSNLVRGILEVFRTI